jgi:hypothetical protein
MLKKILINQLPVIRYLLQSGKVLYKLIDVLFLAIIAVILGCEGWE